MSVNDRLYKLCRETLIEKIGTDTPITRETCVNIDENIHKVTLYYMKDGEEKVVSCGFIGEKT